MHGSNQLLTAQGLHPRLIVDGFDIAKKEALRILDELKVQSSLFVVRYCIFLWQTVESWIQTNLGIFTIFFFSKSLFRNG